MGSVGSHIAILLNRLTYHYPNYCICLYVHYTHQASFRFDVVSSSCMLIWYMYEITLCIYISQAHLLSDFQSFPAKRFSSLEVSTLAIQYGQIIESRSYSRMLETKHLLSNIQSFL